jgi:Bacterial conjugation TrbI-like protein
VANFGGHKIAAGTEIKATLDTPLSTKTAKSGDVFMATVTEPIRSANGDIVVPAGSRLQGEVNESEPVKTLPELRGKGKLRLHFSSIHMPDGSSIPLSARLISLHAKNNASASSEAEVQSRRTGTTIAKDIGMGAGNGTISGSTFGGALNGLALETIDGRGYVLSTNGKEVELPAQTGFTLQVDDDLSVSSDSGGR